MGIKEIMGCFFCAKNSNSGLENRRIVHSDHQHQTPSSPVSTVRTVYVRRESQNYSPCTFSFLELAIATKNFRADCLLGEGGFGRVYKGYLERTRQVVAVKLLNLDGGQGNREFLAEVLMLNLLHHPKLVNMVGYCAEGDQRILVYEYMPLGSLDYHLHDRVMDCMPLDWNTRMKIAADAAEGLEYLHDKAVPQVIYRDLKCSNILLNEEFSAKLSDFGLAKIGPTRDNTHVSTRVMGTQGYCAPEYVMTGQLTLRSDVYSYGVVLLEIITGRRVIDISRGRESRLVDWARPLFEDRNKFLRLADPMLYGQYPSRCLYQAISVAAMCLDLKPDKRPLMADVASSMNYLAKQKYVPRIRQSNVDKETPSGPSTPRSIEPSGLTTPRSRAPSGPSTTKSMK